MTADPDALEDIARAALQNGEEDAALALLRPAAERAAGNARLWQWTGLLARALDRHAAALDAFEQAARLAPGDAGIAHGRAQIAMEAGLPAVALFEEARRLGPMSGEVLTGLAAARFAAGDGEAAIAGLTAMLADNPGWIDGHRTVTQLRTLLTGKAGAAQSFADAVKQAPDFLDLWQAWITTLFAGEAYAEALAVIAQARDRLGAAPWFDLHEAIARSELGETAAADRYFAGKSADGPDAAVWRLRHLIRTGRLDQASASIDTRLDPHDPSIWPYAAAVWRATGDPRWHWLEGDARLVSVADLTDRLPPLDRLASVLRGIHRAHGEHFDQSVRGGTQTDGPLLSRVEPEIQALRRAIVGAVERHVAQLPPRDPRHPTLSRRRDRAPRFAGSWSVRLAGNGHHTNHVHPQGWLSSALYVALPGDIGRGDDRAGWLTLGQPQAGLGLDLAPIRSIAPKPGQLVLFPSTMWHGTVPFSEGERLTVAFDVAPPT